MYHDNTVTILYVFTLGMGDVMAKVKTKYMRMKELKEQLHWYQHLVRGDIASLKRSKEAVYRIAKAMREVQKT